MILNYLTGDGEQIFEELSNSTAQIVDVDKLNGNMGASSLVSNTKPTGGVESIDW